MMTMTIRATAGAALLLLTQAATAQQMLFSRVNADDQFKLFLSDTAAVAGVQFSQGLGWGSTYTGTALPPNTAAGTVFFLNIWVGDIAGAVSGLLGQFKLVGAGSCLFVNGSTNLKTVPNKLWRVTKPLPASVGVPTPPGYPPLPWWNNDPPTFVQPTLIPASWQTNGAGAPYWPTMPGISPTAHWIYTPGLPPPTPGVEVWYQTMIRC